MKSRFSNLCTAFFLLVALSALQLHAQTPKTKLTDFQKGMTAYNLGQFEDALLDFKQALDDDPDSWEAYQQEGYCYFHLGKQTEMMAAFEESLKRNPDNPGLKNFINDLNGITPTPTTVPMEQTAPTPAAPPKSAPASKWGRTPWLNLSAGLSYSGLGDLSDSVQAWNALLAQYHDPGSGSVANVGYQVALEFGQPLDPQETLALSADFETGHGFQEDLGPSGPASLSINPQLFQFGLNYYRYFPGTSSRFFLTGGVLFGLAVADFYQNDPIETIQGPLSGTGLGFTLGLGNEWMISPVMGFQLAGRFRYLSISQLQNNYLVTNGGSGQVVLAIDSQADIGLAAPQNIGQSGLRYMTLDYTGFTANFSFNFYLF